MYRLLKRKSLEYLSEEDEFQNENAKRANQEVVDGDIVQPAVDDTGRIHGNSGENATDIPLSGRPETHREDDGSSAGNNKFSLIGLGDKLQLPLEQRQEFLARRIYGVIRERTRTSKYLSRVCWKGDSKFHRELVQLVKSRATTVLFKWLTIHNDHYHIVHDCTYSNGSCRCFNKFKFASRSTRTVPTQNLTYEDVLYVVQYHFDGTRYTEVLDVGGADYSRLFRGPKNLQHEFDSTGQDFNWGNVEVCSNESEVLWAQQHGLGDSVAAGDSGSENGSYSGRSHNRQRRAIKEKEANKQEQLEAFISLICKVPIHDFVTTDVFLKSEWRFFNNMSITFKNAISTVKLKFLNMNMCDYRRFYESIDSMPYWDTNNREEFESKYLDLLESKKMLLKLLIWQYADEHMDKTTFDVLNNDWKSKVFAYVKDLIMLLDKKRHKLNTDVYLSPPNAGKTLFCDMIRDYMVNCGQMSHWNRNSSFPLQTCGYTRLIFWNEPNYETSVERNLLKLLGGDSYNAAIKNQMDVNISKTPFIVTSNNDPFPHKPEFEYRCKYHYWKSFPHLLKINGKKLHPLAFQYLIDECENYYEDDITHYIEKYNKEHVDKEDGNFLQKMNVSDKIIFAITE